MTRSRRRFLAGGASAVAAGVAGAALVGCKDEPAAAPAGKSGKQAMKPMVAACGISCSVCPAMKAGKCKGCATGKTVTKEKLEKTMCPILKCIGMKDGKIEYCSECKMFSKCKKLTEKLFNQSFIDMVSKKAGIAEA